MPCGVCSGLKQTLLFLVDDGLTARSQRKMVIPALRGSRAEMKSF
jgi:hypothetical protein